MKSEKNIGSFITRKEAKTVPRTSPSLTDHHMGAFETQTLAYVVNKNCLKTPEKCLLTA